MGQTAEVTASSLRLRRSPDGEVITLLPRGTVVNVLGEEDEWMQVEFKGQEGFAHRDFLLKTPDHPPSSVPPAAQPGEVRVDGMDVVGPGGIRFARLFRKGVFSSGRTPIGAFVAEHRDLFPPAAGSLLRIMQAVSDNEGKLEAINTWDNAFLSFGAFQWTSGPDTARGELPAVLQRLKDLDGDAFGEYFRRYGLDVTDVRAVPGSPPTGLFTLRGTPLTTAAQKEQLRTPDWAYRFWRAGHDDTVRRAEVEHAMARIQVFYRSPARLIGQRFIGDFATSELLVALLLDQHVNRPGHVPQTLAQAIAKLQGAPADPGAWTDAIERKLCDLYLQCRTSTSMTDSQKRGDAIRRGVTRGVISDRRGSFQSV
jgi:SH3 domain-containing protein